MSHSADEHVFVAALEQTLHREKLRYIEVRPTQPLLGTTSRWHCTQSYCLHKVDLRPDLTTLFRNCQRSCIQRKIRRAEREGLICETGRSEALLDAFWDLLLSTRRRHRIPPQPKSWFRNLLDCFGDTLQIRVALKGKRPVAAILTLLHKDTLVYKYGCSDAEFNYLGGTPLLFWRAIQDGKRDGVRVFDLGRSESGNTGLITFKDRLGSTRSTIIYSQFTVSPQSDSFGVDWLTRIGGCLVPYLPSGVLRMVGSALYRHIA
jgi:lipid II:glycine glycyltransferase (peptidoglycan interpeptide bridge formation enzyme)